MAAQLLERLPANGADLGSAVWTVRDDGWLDDHPLTWAIRRDTGALRVLLHARMSPNTVVGTNLPLFTAAASRRLGALAILLEWKAEVNARLPSDTTPLFAAVVVQSPACVRLLLQSGARADVHPLGFLGYIQIRPSCRTALSDYCEIVSMLLSTPEANHPVVPRRDIFELVAPTYVAAGHWFLLLMLHVWMRGDRMTGIVPNFKRLPVACGAAIIVAAAG